jgi:hypothetical protein
MSFALQFGSWTDEAQGPAVQFALLYQAFLGAADNPNRARGLEETRAAISVLDAMAEISDLVNAGHPNETRLLKPEGGILTVDAVGHGLLQRSVDAWVGTVPFALAKVAMDVKMLVDHASQSAG